MPYKSDKQRRLFEACRANPSKVDAPCPPRKVLEEFHKAEYPPETRVAHHAQKKRGPVDYR